MQPSYDTAYFALVVCLPLVVRLLMVPRIGEPVRAWSERLGARVWAHLVERDEPDEHQLRRWALVRLDELQHHLARVTALVDDDGDMSATRQLGNRFAYERLRIDVAEALETAPEWVPEPPSPVWQPASHPTWQPTPAVRYLTRPATAGSGTVEVLEF